MVSGRIFDTLNIVFFFSDGEEKEDAIPRSSLSSSLLLKGCARSLDIKDRAEPKKKSKKKKKTKKEKIQHAFESFFNRRKQTISPFLHARKKKQIKSISRSLLLYPSRDKICGLVLLP